MHLTVFIYIIVLAVAMDHSFALQMDIHTYVYHSYINHKIRLSISWYINEVWRGASFDAYIIHEARVKEMIG